MKKVKKVKSNFFLFSWPLSQMQMSQDQAPIGSPKRWTRSAKSAKGANLLHHLILGGQILIFLFFFLSFLKFNVLILRLLSSGLYNHMVRCIPLDPVVNSVRSRGLVAV